MRAKVGGMEYKAWARRSRWMSKETLGCVQSVLGGRFFELVLSMGKINI